MKTQTNKNTMKIFLKQRKFSKKITQFFTIFLCLISFGISAQNIVFGDAEFKNFLLVSTPTNNFVKDINGNSIKVDVNNDGEISLLEAENIGYLNITTDNSVIQSFEGINYFKNLKGISGEVISTQSRDTGLAGSINISNLQNLEFIDFSQFFIKSITVENCEKLKSVTSGTYHYYSNSTTDFYRFINCPLIETVTCIAANLGELSFLNCPSVKAIDVTGNQLNNLDISLLSNLETLYTRNFYERYDDLIDFSKNGITSLDLANKTNLKIIDCNRNSLTDINVQNSLLLEDFNCSSNNISSIDITANQNLKNFNCSGNKITTLLYNNTPNFDLFNASGNLLENDDIDFSKFFSHDNPLLEINLSNNNLNSNININLPKITFNKLNLSNNNLTGFSLLGANNNVINFDNQYGLYLSGNQIISFNTDIKLFNYLDISSNPIESLDVTDLSVYDILNISNTKISSVKLKFCAFITASNLSSNSLKIICNAPSGGGLYLDNNPNLEVLDIGSCPIPIESLSNNPKLRELYIKNGEYTPIYVFNTNPSLHFICCDDSEINYIKTRVDELGLTNSCVVNSYCSFVPGGNYNTITGKVRFDENNNDCDVNDAFFEHMKLKINDGAKTGETFVKADGTYSFFTQAGTFTITAEPENATLFSVNPASFSAHFADNNNNVFSQDICVSKTNNSQDLEVIIAPITNARPGFPATYKLMWRNKGNTNLSGTVSLNFEGNKMSFNSSSIPYSSVSANSVSYSFSGIKPYENKASEIEFTINPPTHATNPVNLNDILTFTANGNIVGNDSLPDDNMFSLKQTVVGSYDPNDIVCLEGDLVTEEKIGDYFHYVVNFENTGTAEAENIVIEMDIDTNDFDISTLQLQNATGEVYTRVSGNKAEFIFKKIKLGSGGHGNVLLKMKSKSTLTKNDLIVNRANIYFDYNFPVKTNDAITKFYDLLNNNEVKDKDNIVVFPIPAKDELNISSEKNIKSIEIYDEIGRIIQTVKGNTNIQKINITKLEKGTYYLFIKTNDEVKTKKFIKE